MLFKGSTSWRKRKSPALREAASRIHWVPLSMRWGFEVSGWGTWGPKDPSVLLHAALEHTWSILRWYFPPCRGSVSLPTCNFDTWCNHFSLFYVLFEDIIRPMLNPGLCNTERFVIIEPTDVKGSGWHGKLSGPFSQVSKQNRFKLQ